MLLCSMNGDWTANTPIGLVKKLTTNNNASLNATNNGINITVPGWYRVRVQANLTATATSTGFSILANSTTLTTASETTITGDTLMLNAEYPVHIIPTTQSGSALITIVPSTGATLVAGYVEIERID